MVLLVLARALVRFVPFHRLRCITGEPAAAAAEKPGRSRGRAASRIGCAVRRASRRLPGNSSCLVLALAARMMLTMRGVPSTLVVGVAPYPAGIRAHAWLLAEGGIVCGGTEAAGFMPLAHFGALGR